MLRSIVLSLIVLAAPFAFADSNVQTQNFDVQGLKELSVENTSGQVTISAEAVTEATVVATKKKFPKGCELKMGREKEELKIEVEDNSGWFSSVDCQVDLEIKIPANLKLEIELGSGQLNVTGVSNELEFKVGSGNIKADGQFSKIDGKSGSGNIDVKGLTGGGEIKTGSGDIQLTFAQAELRGELDVKTGSGDAVLNFMKGTKLKSSFKAGSGSMSNELGDTPDAAFKVSMKTGAGDLNVKSY